MENKGNMSPQAAAIENLVGNYLRARSASDLNGAASGPHLDHDSMAAFTEGNLSEREAKPIVSHLVDCSFCRHVTAELVRLDMAFAENPITAAAETTEPSKVSEVLSGLLSRIFGTNDDAVFAHHEKGEEEENKDSEDPREN